MEYNIGKTRRLRRQKDIACVFDCGLRVSDRFITLRAAGREAKDLPAGESRMAVAVSARYGTAVRRNRVKRLCREAFRLVRPELPAGMDYVIVPKRLACPTLEELKDSLRALAKRIV